MLKTGSAILISTCLSLSCEQAQDYDIQTPDPIEASNDASEPTSSGNEEAVAPAPVGGVFLNANLLCEVDPLIEAPQGKVATGCRFRDNDSGATLPRKQVFEEANIEVIDSFNSPVNIESKKASEGDAWHWHLEIPEDQSEDAAVKAKSLKDQKVQVAVKVAGFIPTGPPKTRNELPLGRSDNGNNYDFIFGHDAFAIPSGCADSQPTNKGRFISPSSIKITFTATIDTRVAINLEGVCGIDSFNNTARVIEVGTNLVQSELYMSPKQSTTKLNGFSATKGQSYALEITVGRALFRPIDDFRIDTITFSTESEGALKMLAEPETK